MKIDKVEENPYQNLKVVSFTGTRRGMTSSQKDSFSLLLDKLNAEVLVHGDCIGADSDAHYMSLDKGISVHKRPSTSKTRGYAKGGSTVSYPKPPLIRNEDIINDGDCVVATPRLMREELKSGTWAAVRYARKQDHLIWIVWPDGSLSTP